MLSLVNSSGILERDVLRDFERKNLALQKEKHSEKGYRQRVGLLINTMI